MYVLRLNAFERRPTSESRVRLRWEEKASSAPIATLILCPRIAQENITGTECVVVVKCLDGGSSSVALCLGQTRG